MNINSIILSAGKGTRMKSDLPKVVQKVCDYEMVNLVLKSLVEAKVDNNYLIVGYQKEEVLKRIDPKFKVDYVEQKEQLGTGHAIKIAKEKLGNLGGITLITCGDTPLVTSETFTDLIEFHKENKNDLTILTATIDDPNGYGRIVRDSGNLVAQIVEQKDASDQQLLIKEINTGIYCFDNKKLFEYIDLIDNNNAAKEYYLTDLVEIFNKNNEKVNAFITSDIEETLGVNDLVALSNASKILQRRINRQFMLEGVNIIDPDSTYISAQSKIGTGAIIEPNVIIKGTSVIGDNSDILSGSYISNSEIGDGTSIGPYAHIRENSKVGNECRVGNYVEIKKSVIANQTKAAHLTYIGDATVGTNVNFGCGTIIANYDGVNKHNTIIGDNVFIGSNSNIVAPCEIENDVFIAAGTTVTSNVEENKFVIDRNKMRIKPRRSND